MGGCCSSPPKTPAPGAVPSTAGRFSDEALSIAKELRALPWHDVWVSTAMPPSTETRMQESWDSGEVPLGVLAHAVDRRLLWPHGPPPPDGADGADVSRPSSGLSASLSQTRAQAAAPAPSVSSAGRHSRRDQLTGRRGDQSGGRRGEQSTGRRDQPVGRRDSSRPVVGPDIGTFIDADDSDSEPAVDTVAQQQQQSPPQPPRQPQQEWEPHQDGSVESVSLSVVSQDTPGEPTVFGEALSQAEWESDKASKECRKCGDPFTLSRRRHHCRACGLLYCGRCTTHRLRMWLPGSIEGLWRARLATGTHVFEIKRSPDGPLLYREAGGGDEFVGVLTDPRAYEAASGSETPGLANADRVADVYSTRDPGSLRATLWVRELSSGDLECVSRSPGGKSAPMLAERREPRKSALHRVCDDCLRSRVLQRSLVLPPAAAQSPQRHPPTPEMRQDGRR
eukprot:TRINITY_DN13155_c0_g1_i1.p1 TRINITY_DN13155_c0_g1~~TRINITY_DN13155_c0_g1_i1.p1  ORF type:complete len:469 (+),score=161.06 TRINITY_DN13155_c0_g1_i1:57-1409(+)